MRALVLLLGLAACGGWTHKDTVLELSFLVAASGDEMQTQAITFHCAETNPIVGPCGRGPGGVGGYFFVADIVHAGISALLPAGAPRTFWQGLTTGGELATVWKNYGDGFAFWP